MTDDFNPFTEEIEAVKRIASTGDGRLLHRYLRRVLETVIDLQEGGALQAQNGRRSLARDLMKLMAEGIDDRRDDHGNDPILARSARPVVVGRQRRDRRNLPRVDSFPDDLNPDGSVPTGGD